MSFSERQKLEAAIIYILKKQPIEILRLAKFIYLSDYLYAKTFGDKRPITGGYYREKLGPVPNAFYPAINDMLSKNIVNRTGNIITLKKSVRTVDLSEEEVACIDKIIRDFKNSAITKLLKVTYDTEPMKKVQEKELALNVDKLLGERVTFDETVEHPLLDNKKLDTKFMDSPEFLANLRDA